MSQKKETVKIDGVTIPFSVEDANIVETAQKAGIGIPAPCFLAKRKKGCCNGCVVEIDGKQQFACATKAKEGMEITVNREDLKALRKERLKAYQEGIKSGNPCVCSETNTESECGSNSQSGSECSTGCC